MTDDFAAFPSTIELSRTQPARRYTRRADLIAIHGALPSGLAAGEGETLAPGITLLPSGPAGRVHSGARVTPVYVLDTGAQPLVPTGRVLVRFAEGESAEGHRGDLESAGYRLAESLPYARHAVWVESPQGWGAALRDLPRLDSLPGVVHVEPEMVGRRATR